MEKNHARGSRVAPLSKVHADPFALDELAHRWISSLCYGGSVPDTYLLAGVYAGRILKGEKPGELPVQRGTKVELFLNLKTANALGITVPLPLSGRSDELIE